MAEERKGAVVTTAAPDRTIREFLRDGYSGPAIPLANTLADALRASRLDDDQRYGIEVLVGIVGALHDDLAALRQEHADVLSGRHVPEKIMTVHRNAAGQIEQVTTMSVREGA